MNEAQQGKNEERVEEDELVSRMPRHAEYAPSIAPFVLSTEQSRRDLLMLWPKLPVAFFLSLIIRYSKNHDSAFT